jgi:hypothetical protein
MDQRLIRRCGPQFGPDQRVRRGGHLGRNEKEQDCLSLRWVNDSGKDGKLLKIRRMVDPSSFMNKWQSHIT